MALRPRGGLLPAAPQEDGHDPPVVGTILFGINQLDVVLRGDATAVVWVKIAVTYLVPFCVSSAGVLVASRRASPTPEHQPPGGGKR